MGGGPPLLIDKSVAKEERPGVGCGWVRNLGRFFRGCLVLLVVGLAG